MIDYEDKRAQNTALAGLLLQTAMAGLFCAVWLVTGSLAAAGLLWIHVGGILVWSVTAVVFYCRRMSELEQGELEEIASRHEGIFDKSAEMRLAGRRLEIVLKWIIPLAGLIIAAGFISVGGMEISGLLKKTAQYAKPESELSWAFFCLGGAFLGFLFSRYALGMARDERWRLLRSGGSILSVATIIAALQCAAFFMSHIEITWGQTLLPYLVFAVMAVIGVEILLNLVLDFYRPRKPGEILRPAFDSRLASLVSEPGGIAHSIAEAINYQFGFEVSSTWFYQLLRRTLAPLLIFGILALFAISTVVVVPAGSVAIVFTWGKHTGTLGEGPHLKAPWPIQSADLVNVSGVRTLVIGETERANKERIIRPGEKLTAELFLWTENHGETLEMNLLTASKNPLLHENTETSDPKRSASERYSAFSMLRVVLYIQYTVSDPEQYHLGVSDPDMMLKNISMQQLTSYLAHRDVDTLLGYDGLKIAPDLKHHIAQAAEKLDLGIEILDVNVRGIHPPTDVADAFHLALTAEQERIGNELVANTSAETQLGNTAGSRELAEAIAQAATRLHELRSNGASQDEITKASLAADALLEQAGGEVKTVINSARAERWEQENNESARWILAVNQQEAYQAAPELFLLDEKLRVLRDALSEQQKYVVGLDPDKLEIRYSDDRRTTGGGFNLSSD